MVEGHPSQMLVLRLKEEITPISLDVNACTSRNLMEYVLRNMCIVGSYSYIQSFSPGSNCNRLPSCLDSTFIIYRENRNK